MQSMDMFGDPADVAAIAGVGAGVAVGVGIGVGTAVGLSVGIGVGEAKMPTIPCEFPIAIPTIRVSPRTRRHKVTRTHRGIDTVRLCLRGSPLITTVIPLPVYVGHPFEVIAAF